MKSVDNPFYTVVSKVDLPPELNEISGLTYYKQGKFLAVQDELGLIYVLDEATGQIDQELKFGKKGDYEGIALVRNKVYVLRSDGDLYYHDLSTGISGKLHNPFAKDFEFEGLCYEQSKSRLILSCKSANKSKLDKKMLFYGYDLHMQKWVEEPIYSIKKKDIEERAGFNLKTVKASGIVQHPVSQDFYVVASLGSLLIQLDAQFKLKRVIPLYDNFNQPEGISINANGDLIISNEAASKKQQATLYTLLLK